MAYPNALRILYVGRKTDVVAGLQALFEQQSNLITQNGADGQPLLEFVAVSSQKAALHLVRTYLPLVVMVEIINWPDGRAKLCEMLRYRLSSAAIVAIGAPTPACLFTFDGVIDIPLSPQQVVDTIRNVRHGRVEHQLQVGSICVNTATRTVTTRKGEYPMTPKQCALLQMLMLNHGSVVSRKAIMESIWETSYLEDTRTLDVHVRWLRERIEPDPSNPSYLKTVRGVGYRLWIS